MIWRLGYSLYRPGCPSLILCTQVFHEMFSIQPIQLSLAASRKKPYLAFHEDARGDRQSYSQSYPTNYWHPHPKSLEIFVRGFSNCSPRGTTLIQYLAVIWDQPTEGLGSVAR